MEEEDTQLYLQLHKLSAIKSEEELQHILHNLWRTRKTGLPTPEKSYFQSLLNLPSLVQLDPVLACLRSLIRKCAREDLSGDDILKLFPPDLPLDLQTILIMLLQKHQNQWKEEILRDQHTVRRTGLCHQVNVGLLPSFSSFPSSEMTPTLWSQQDDPIAHLNHKASAPIIGETNVSPLAPLPLHCDVDPPDNLGMLPRLKSMTWTVENQSKARTNRVAVISLKLQDYTKSPLGDMEVKFTLTRDTHEAMLRSMIYISEKLSSSVGSTSGAGPLQKRARQ